MTVTYKQDTIIDLLKEIKQELQNINKTQLACSGVDADNLSEKLIGLLKEKGNPKQSK